MCTHVMGSVGYMGLTRHYRSHAQNRNYNLQIAVRHKRFFDIDYKMPESSLFSEPRKKICGISGCETARKISYDQVQPCQFGSVL